VTDPQPTKDSPRRTADALARTVGTVTSQVDKVADHVERLSEGVVHRASARVERYRFGALAVDLIHRLRDAIVFMLRDWRLVLLQVPAAISVSFVLFRVRVRARGAEEIVSMTIPSFFAAAALSVLLFLTVYTCSTVFAISLTKTPPGQRADLNLAWAETKSRWRRVVAWSLASGLAVGGLFALARNFERLGYTVLGLIGLGVIVGLIAIVPVRIATVAKRKLEGSRFQRARGAALGSSASFIIEAPTIGMAEVGRLFTQIPGLRIFGYAAVGIGGLLHMAASSSTRAFKFNAKLTHGEEGSPIPETAPASGGPEPGPSPSDQQLDDEQQHRSDDQGDDRAAHAEA
jgi:hypothetical protein